MKIRALVAAIVLSSAEVDHDEAVLNRVLDERFVLNSGSGKPVNKASIIKSVLG